MKISISGKGGSGKSTITALLAMELRDRDYRPIIVDSDESNSILYRMLGMKKPPQPLVSLAGGRQMVRQLMPPGYTPGERGQRTHVLTQARISLEDIPQENVARKDNLRLVVIGKIAEPMEGCACPMGVLGREFLAKLQLADNEIALVDMEAGIEHFGRGVEANLDSVLTVVEPSFESVSLAERINHLSNGMGIKQVWAILNKVNIEAIHTKLTDELAQRGVRVIGSVPYDEEVFTACLEGLPLSKGKGKMSVALRKIVDCLLCSDSTP